MTASQGCRCPGGREWEGQTLGWGGLDAAAPAAELAECSNGELLQVAGARLRQLGLKAGSFPHRDA